MGIKIHSIKQHPLPVRSREEDLAQAKVQAAEDQAVFDALDRITIEPLNPLQAWVDEQMRLRGVLVDIEHELDRIELRGPYAGFKLGAQNVRGRLVIFCAWTAKDSLTGKESHFRTAAWVRGPGDVVKTAHDLVRASLLHELDEHFAVDGDLVFFPHDAVALMDDPFILERS